MSRVSRFPNGVTTVAQNDPLGQFGLPDVTGWHTYFNDFDTYVAGDWTITTTEAGAGSATEALTNVDGGVLLVTNAAGDNDADFFNKVGESFLFKSNKKMVFKARVSVSDATQSDFVMGLQITDTTPLAVTDGVYFRKDDGDANIDFVVIKDSAATTAVAGTLVAATFIELAFYYDGKDSIKYYIDGTHKGTSVTTNLPDDEELTISFGIQNGEAAVKTASIDYIFASCER